MGRSGDDGWSESALPCWLCWHCENTPDDRTQARAFQHVLPTAELVLKHAASMASFDRRSAALATLRRGLLIRGSLVRSQLGEPIFQQLRRRPAVPCLLSVHLLRWCLLHRHCTFRGQRANGGEAATAEVSRRRDRECACPCAPWSAR